MRAEPEAFFRAEAETTAPLERSARAAVHAVPEVMERAVVRGKFLYVGADKFWVKGVTYGTFRPDHDGHEYPVPEVVHRDFAAMAANGMNTLRTYTVPPRWLLDVAQQHGLRVMVGLPWEQHVTFLDQPKRADSIAERVRVAVSGIAGHPAVLCYAVGNEIPASIVRWHGAKKIEQFLHRLYRATKQEDPTALVTYVNFPTTEYLQLSFLDLVCFNVYLESRETLEAYLARLHNLTDDRPLLMAEIGLDSLRNSEEMQARVLDWQVRTVFESGACGAFVYAWTDEWHRGGHDITDWGFGLTCRDRSPKPALGAVNKAYAEVPFHPKILWPKFSVVVCSFNGAHTIRDTLDALQRLEYPDFEVIVVNDGSTDATATIAKQYPVRLITTENRGLSRARNTGLEAATGEIVAYIDDDAYPDPDWLHYLALNYLKTDHVGVGGPNLAPPGDGPIAECVANSPGGPVHVLLSDTLAEHIPGCNMSFRKSALEAIGGFDPRYRAAGDDVDVCWRIQDQVGTIGFSPAAMVWHHRRNSVHMYWKQQQGYGKAEAMLEEKWPRKYNTLGHTTWGGRLYGKGLTLNLGALRGRIYQGVWGTAPFQSLYQASPTTLWSLPLMPEWYLVVACLAAVSLLGLAWSPFFYAVPFLILAVALPVAQATVSASRARLTSDGRPRWQRMKRFALIACMHLLQPLARLIGRIRHGLTPWRRRGTGSLGWPRPITASVWREQWEDPADTLRRISSALSQAGAVVTTGGGYDAWDLKVCGGLFGSVRLTLAVEEHGGGNQLGRCRLVPQYSGLFLVAIATTVLLALMSGFHGAWLMSLGFAFAGIAIGVCWLVDAATAFGGVLAALQSTADLRVPEGGFSAPVPGAGAARSQRLARGGEEGPSSFELSLQRAGQAPRTE